MKPAPFKYVAPTELEQVLELLAEHGDDAKILAGGQSLGPMLNLRLVSPTVLIDINGVRELDHRSDEDAYTLGSLTRQSVLEDDPNLRNRQPLVAMTIPHIAHRPIRNRGTVGGSLVHADPAAEWGALVLALDAELSIVRHGAPTRTVEAVSFFEGWLETAVSDDELLAQIRLPFWPSATGASYRGLARRHGDFALAAVACRLSLSADGRITQPRIAMIGVSDRPVRIFEAEDIIAQQVAESGLFDDAIELAAQSITPHSDLHASAEYRRTITKVLLREALEEALIDAKRRHTQEREIPAVIPLEPATVSAPDSIVSQKRVCRISSQKTVSITVNGQPVIRDVQSQTTLVDFLRHDLQLTGTHVGCEHGVCGACTVLIDGRAQRSCTLYAVQIDGTEIRTVEGLANGETLHPLQTAFDEHKALQCGYCTPGFLMSALDLLSREASPSEYQVREALSGSLCRCTGYEPIVNAVMSVVTGKAEG